MPRIAHGQIITLDQLRRERESLARRSADMELAFAAALPVDVQDFGFLFPDLQADPAQLMPESVETVAQLVRLGRTMRDPGDGANPGDSTIPAAYTYFGQFVDHDITLEAASAPVEDLLSPTLTPLAVDAIRATLRNARTATLDLDSVYGFPASRDPVNPDKLLLGRVTAVGGTSKPFLRPPGKDDHNDLPREPRSSVASHDRAALIGDPRNDENTIIAQLHVAFLRAHNAIVDRGYTFEQARTLLRQHYQCIVIHDFLRRVADPQIVDDILQNGNRVYDALAEPFFLPLEFSVAAYRFGHSMARGAYDFNLNFNFSGEPGTFPATFALLFTFSALSGELGDFDTLPEHWIVEWENLVDAGTDAPFNTTRRLDTKLVEPLFLLPDLRGQVAADHDSTRLAVRNLLRGYLLRMPTGQAVAEALGLTPLTAAEIEAAAASPQQAQVLRDTGFLQRTPLWYYLLAEATHGGGQHLGPVGSTIVAEVLIGLARRSEDSILRQTGGWTPMLPSAQPDHFELADLVRLAGVLPSATPTRKYTVQSGDTLAGIAQQELGDASRWHEIFVLNRSILRDPDLVVPGQVLTLPDPTAPPPSPPIHVVRSGETLSSIARERLGNANRWFEIWRRNRAQIPDPNLIFVGQVLILPA